MEIIRTISEMEEITSGLKRKDKTISFVPTMGYLHEGHTSLMDKGKEYADILITSIFVNPLQFGPDEDFERYPRNEKQDQLIAQKHGVDYLFMPTAEEMYPGNHIVSLHVKKRTDVLCGKSRPGHFDGVVTVLTKLFHITKADFVFFGLKDAQQAAVVQGLIDDFNFPVKLVAGPTVREEDGLAKSSRNVYLTKEERQEAIHLYKSLQFGQQLIIDGENNPVMIKEKVENYLQQKITGLIDYVEVLTFPGLEKMDKINQQLIIAIAVQYANARLIDNIIIKPNGAVPHISA